MLLFVKVIIQIQFFYLSEKNKPATYFVMLFTMFVMHLFFIKVHNQKTLWLINNILYSGDNLLKDYFI